MAGGLAGGAAGSVTGGLAGGVAGRRIGGVAGGLAGGAAGSVTGGLAGGAPGKCAGPRAGGGTKGLSLLGLGVPFHCGVDGRGRDEMREILEGMTARTWKRDRERLLSLATVL